MMREKRYSDWPAFFGVFIILLIALMVRNTPGKSFRHGAEKNSAQAFEGINLVDPAGMKELPANSMVLSLGETQTIPSGEGVVVEDVAPDQLYDRKFLRRIKRNSGPVIIVSASESMAAVAWMILAQEGVGNIFLLSGENNRELFKHEFRPSAQGAAE